MSKWIWLFLAIALGVLVWDHAKAAEPNDYKIRHEEMIYSVVLVDVRGGSGSGTVVFSKKLGDEWHTYILTNNHVVRSLVSIEDVWDSAAGKKAKKEKRKPLQVRWFDYNDYSRAISNTSKKASIVAWNEDLDLGLVRVDDTERGVDTVAYIMPKDVYPHLTEHVWAVGAGLGRPPFATGGNVSLNEEVVNGNPFMLMSAPIIYGNSGGALFRWSDERQHFELAGVPALISVVGFGSIVQSMSWAIPIQTVYQFLEDACYGPIVEEPLGEDCDELGEAAKPAKED